MNVEEQNAEKTTPMGYDSSKKTEPSSADYVVNDTGNLDRPKRETRAPTYLGEFVCRITLPKEKID